MEENVVCKAAVEIIQQFISESIPNHILLHRQEPMQRSYYIWAANEVLNTIKHNPSIPPLVTIMYLRRKMEQYSSLNKGSGYLFSVAYDAVTDILDLFV